MKKIIYLKKSIYFLLFFSIYCELFAAPEPEQVASAEFKVWLSAPPHEGVSPSDLSSAETYQMRGGSHLENFSGLSFYSSSVSSTSQELGSKIWISKSDDALNGEPESGLDLNVAADHLHQVGIEVLEAKKAHDGRMRIQMCGTPRGTLNAFRISSLDLQEAKKFGYEVADENIQEYPSGGSFVCE